MPRAFRSRKLRARLVLGSARVNLAPGERRTVSLRLSGTVAGLAVHGEFQARVQVASSDAAGNSAARSLAVGLRIPHP